MTDTDRARSQAEAQLEHIRELIEWLEHANECDEDDCVWNNDASLGNGGHDVDAANRAIDEHPLSVLVREDWHVPGEHENAGATEFELLLCTGGPAVRIRGTLDEHSEPDTARIEYQDWGTPWIELEWPGTEWSDGGIRTSKSNATLLRYCQQFYYGG